MKEKKFSELNRVQKVFAQEMFDKLDAKMFDKEAKAIFEAIAQKFSKGRATMRLFNVRYDFDGKEFAVKLDGEVIIRFNGQEFKTENEEFTKNKAKIETDASKALKKLFVENTNDINDFTFMVDDEGDIIEIRK